MEVRLRCLRNYSRREIFFVAFCESTVTGVAVSLSDSSHESIVFVRTDGMRALAGCGTKKSQNFNGVWQNCKKYD